MNTLVYYTTLALYLVINVLFVEKYAARVTDYHLLFSLAYLLGAYLSINIILKKVATSFLSTKWLICVGFLFICIALGIQYKINPLTIQVDRWSAIHNFLVNLFQGNYPYGSSTHLGGYGSPFSRLADVSYSFLFSWKCWIIYYYSYDCFHSNPIFLSF